MELETKRIGKKTYSQREEVDRIAKEVIESEKLDLGEARIKFLLVHPNISKRVAGRCIRNYEAAEAMTDYHYFIEFSGDIWDKISDTAKHTLMLHELMHVYPTRKADGTIRYALLQHDVMDFRRILVEHGFDWLNEIDKVRAELKEEQKKKNKEPKKEEIENIENKEIGVEYADKERT